MNTKRKKQRGAGRRLKALLRNIDGIRPFVRTNDATEHFHVPCGGFIDSRRTRGKIKTEFIEKWIDTAIRFIERSRDDLPFCRVVAMIRIPCLWESQIIIFYDEDYYQTFFERWIEDSGASLMKSRNIEREIGEMRYFDPMDYYSRGKNIKSELWFYGELQSTFPIKTLTDTNHGTV